jgi:predicted ATP-dependent endonuclease of OLD family
MRIKKLKLENFRAYKEEVEIEFNALNVFVGKNDIGKSTILEALDIFFNENKGVIKIDKDDINKKCLAEGNTNIKISVIFDELPSSLTIDATNPTTLEEEYLLLEDGTLEIVKKYPNGGKEKVFIGAYHPTNSGCKDLLLQKIIDLKKILVRDNIECSDKTKSAEIRKSIWEHNNNDLRLDNIEIEIAKLDAKNTWEQLKNYMPLYSLFQSDRKNSDGDGEVQNPMKFAVQEILKDESLKDSLDKVAKEVEKKLNEVSKRTLEKLNEMNPEIANGLTPVIPKAESLKWMDVFKSVSITDDEDIPINKRGSGVKRLILLNFFRAEAERRQKEKNVPNIIYAIEEPETSQHPEHQKYLIDAFIELSKSINTQIVLTTHSPAIVKMLDFEYLKLINKTSSTEIKNIEKGNLPYPSLNEINYLAFSESNEEYHNELYGFIESENLLSDCIEGEETMKYFRLKKNGELVEEQKILSEYIRHQIHHPENTNNAKFSSEQLHKSISDLRTFIQANKV